MSRLLSFCIYDSKAQIWMAPMFLLTRADAERGFSGVVNDPQKKSVYSQYPADFTLFQIGEYDQLTGKQSFLDAPFSLGVGIEFVQASPTIRGALDRSVGNTQ